MHSLKNLISKHSANLFQIFPFHQCLKFLFSATEPNSSMQSNDPLLVPGSPASPHGYLGPSGSGDAHSSSSTEDIRVEFVPMAEALGQSYKNRQTTLVQHLSGSLSRAWKRTRNRKSVELASKHYSVYKLSILCIYKTLTQLLGAVELAAIVEKTSRKCLL